MASFKKHSDKKWEYRIRYKDPITDSWKEKSKRGFSTKPEAKKAAQEMEQKINEGFEMDKQVTLKHFIVNEWLEGVIKNKDIRKNTIQSHEFAVKNHIVPYFKDKIKLDEIKPAKYQEFLNHMADKGYSKRTIEIVHNSMNGAMKLAVTRKKITTNPCDGAIIPKVKKENKDKRLEYMESGDISHFLLCARQYGYPYYIFFKVLLETGLRKGEAAALCWSDVDIANGTIRIEKSLDFQAKNKEELFGDTKTYHSKRKITISKSLAHELQFHLKWQNQNKLTMNETYHHDLNLVLCREDGNFMPKSSLFNAFERILKRAGITKMPIHALRHSHAVILLEAGADMKYVQERLGHKSISITSDVYSHISKRLEQDNLNKYESYMDNILKD
ncbi:site-specific integrase [Evansella tamaricis]|uniref:Site-specific integrase n=1 Tax=Evansella tamaricis TaxID=2069301 RepID=A0ABS6JMN4_9BACI|nr:site-specific integrase [Evansella tamaricis]MBU9714459.1 site-specific integrase [Evansella tamaricis]